MSWYTKLPTLKVSSPSHFFKSPELINSSGDHIYKKVVMNQVRHPFKLLVQKFGRLRSQIHCKVPQATVRQQPCKALSHGICHLRTVPTIVIAHTFCASRDTRISYR